MVYGAAMTSRLHQITVGYSRIEDRLLLRIAGTGKDEYRLWLTRYFVKAFWDGLIKLLRSSPEIQAQAFDEAKSAMLSFQHEEAVQGSDFTQPHDTDDKDYPLGEAPMLVTGVQCAAGEKQTTRISFQTLNKLSVTINLNPKLLHSLLHLLSQGEGQAEWGLNLAIGEAAAPPDQAQVH